MWVGGLFLLLGFRFMLIVVRRWQQRFYLSFGTQIDTLLLGIGGPEEKINRQKCPKMGLRWSLPLEGFRFTCKVAQGIESAKNDQNCRISEIEIAFSAGLFFTHVRGTGRK